ncbi:TPA: tyrosine--tRNA ligase [Candidatus Collierbacteria bacterium]|uniref:Tyrosine--tRNA ligase n=1 Tax=Candidatus Collierbacteria bacterium GW2011_GWA2_42_17 TaxID=1618378 RepID=A0A0G0Z275_9BACT|nr:MAG: Tyrosine-tRNA ligase [Candidatus Collierbacteria bacterium GW2011_GWB2_42_12]KKS42874.1 MAG: Tyrosine-tRNA ligase [Candidatus Collierbacteria bacterium GW2011_GWA2_42_17]KKS62984.1 MAG: Tyrosine-tRNA ligase [Candidatus Collierbacteria bacterium GW2011_GWE2_42_48]KKS63278.1 MAG: Tyrosine-tRNA ligase [Candidatus Collierbacteria bacterium GW2011_GWD2_42_50]KKS63320.1 MAG: Tyrosine-tRNA ligase [Candidatus Collierbacteria bacterium GW2011_GWF1_42_50]KKS64452.1 MAG: Tyrosine-tRNA ligase [Can
MEEAEKKAKIDSFLTRGVENIVPGKAEVEKLLNSGKVLNVYLGIDPTATKIHLGHAFPLRKLQILAELGHHVTFLIGDFTAIVGDTSDKESERPILTREQIEENFQTYKRQAKKFLDFSKIELHFNSEWLSKLDFAGVLKLTSHFSLNDFISRELIKKRLAEGKSISLPEVLYPIMQGYDSMAMDTDIQIGGTDQIFNMQAGRTLIKNIKGKDSSIVANGFLPGTDGRKMSKTWGNAIWIEDSPEEIFGKVMSLKDNMILTYYLMGTNVDNVVIEDAKKRLESGENPMNIKRELARTIVKELCGKGEVDAAEEFFQKTVVEKKVDENAPEVRWDKETITVEDLIRMMVELSMATSNGEAKRLIEQGGVYLNGVRVEKKSVELPVGKGVVRVGKRKYLKIVR